MSAERRHATQQLSRYGRAEVCLLSRERQGEGGKGNCRQVGGWEGGEKEGTEGETGNWLDGRIKCPCQKEWEGMPSVCGVAGVWGGMLKVQVVREKRVGSSPPGSAQR